MAKGNVDSDKRGHKWRPLKRSTTFKPPTEEMIQGWMKYLGTDDRAEAIAKAETERDANETWINDLYQVQVRRYEEDGYAWINIRRIDGAPCIRDWRHFQQIKNEICGEECEGVELYPAESRLVDTSNKYHIFVCLDPTFRFPFGYRTRDVQFGDEKVGGMRQRPPSLRKGNT